MWLAESIRGEKKKKTLTTSLQLAASILTHLLVQTNSGFEQFSDSQLQNKVGLCL